MDFIDIFRRQAPAAPKFAPHARAAAAGTAELEAPSPRPVSELPDVHLPDTERIRALAQHSQAESVVFQSVALGALQLLDRVLHSERRLADAAISLAQREKLQHMIASLEATADALRHSLSREGSKILTLSNKPQLDGQPERSWWFSLTDTMHVLEEGTEWIATVVAGQPKGGAARLLSSIIARLLHSHYNKLLAEANQWME